MSKVVNSSKCVKSVIRAYYMAASLNYFSYFLLTPFSILWDPLTLQYKLHSNLLRKTLYILCNLGFLLLAIVWLSNVGRSVNNNPQDLIRILGLIMLLSVVFAHIFSFKVLLFHQDKLTLILTDIRKLTKPVSEKKTFGTCILFSGVIVAFYISNLNGGDVYRTLTAFVRAVYKMVRPCSSSDFQTSNSTVTLENVINYVYYLSWPTVGCFCMPEFVAISIVLSLWEAAKCFRAELSKITSFDEGYLLYKTYRKLFNDINELWSPIFLILYIGSVAYYGKAPYVVLTQHPDIGFIVFFAENLLIWGLGSHVHKMMTFTVKQWARNMQEENALSLEARLRLISLSHEVDTEPVGITCSFFTLTYSFLGSMIGLLVTYASIIHQNIN